MGGRGFVRVVGAREKNLRNVSVDIPKGAINVFTGVSGSGKSSLVFDTVAVESQRQLNETYPAFVRSRLPHHGQPDFDAIENLPVAIIIDQKRIGGNARSTVGTITDVNSFLRLLFSRVGKPFVGYSDVFSFNNPSGMCPECQGIGKVDAVDVGALLDRDKSLSGGAILFPTFRPGDWRWKRYALSGFFDNDKPIRDYSPEELDLLLYEKGRKVPAENPDWPKTALYEGVVPRIEKAFLRRDTEERRRRADAIAGIVKRSPCPSCGGARLNANALSCRIGGRNIADCAAMPIGELAAFLGAIDDPVAAAIVPALVSRLRHLEEIGLGYLTLDRETSTLSGGESQRIKMVRQLGSSLADLLYIFDEPSIGLHPHDVERVNALLRELRDKGNTVLVVEHDPDVIAVADHVFDLGPRAGREGGRIVYDGDLKGLMRSPSLTGRCLRTRGGLKPATRTPSGWLPLRDVSLHNLRDVGVDVPSGVLAVVTGVAGSGKSSLMRQAFLEAYPGAVAVDQRAPHAQRRSNVATFAGFFDGVRTLFARANKVDAALFSHNSRGGCPTCGGRGEVTTELAFMDPVVLKCETCGGGRYNPEALSHAWNGATIADVLEMTVDEAAAFFAGRDFEAELRRLSEVGVGYLSLGQPLTTLSGGEVQRVKLAARLENRGEIFILDEPTTGLHMADVDVLAAALDRIVDGGNTVVVIEHNLDLVRRADWIIDLGPGAGADGGTIVYSGEPRGILDVGASLTGRHLKAWLSGSTGKAAEP